MDKKAKEQNKEQNCRVMGQAKEAKERFQKKDERASDQMNAPTNQPMKGTDTGSETRT